MSGKDDFTGWLLFARSHLLSAVTLKSSPKKNSYPLALLNDYAMANEMINKAVLCFCGIQFDETSHKTDIADKLKKCTGDILPDELRKELVRLDEIENSFRWYVGASRFADSMVPRVRADITTPSVMGRAHRNVTFTKEFCAKLLAHNGIRQMPVNLDIPEFGKTGFSPSERNHDRPEPFRWADDSMEYVLAAEDLLNSNVAENLDLPILCHCQMAVETMFKGILQLHGFSHLFEHDLTVLLDKIRKTTDAAIPDEVVSAADILNGYAYDGKYPGHTPIKSIGTAETIKLVVSVYEFGSEQFFIENGEHLPDIRKPVRMPDAVYHICRQKGKKPAKIIRKKRSGGNPSGGPGDGR